MKSERWKQISVLSASTLAFTVCFAAWVMFSIIGIPLKQELGLNETQFGLLVATPILTGSLIRLPLGMLTDRLGGRIVFFLLLLATIVPIYLIGEAHAYWQFLVLGLFIGFAGGAFSVGISYVAHWFGRDRQGLAMGIFGAGNAGAALTKFVAPSIVVAYGWSMVPKIYAAAMLVIALLFWLITYTDPNHLVSRQVTLRDQLRVLRDPKVWKYSQYYSLVFGGYVGLALWMTKYYVAEYGFDLKLAALLAAAFSLPGGVLRAFGGWLSDRWGAHPVTWWVLLVSWICLFFLSYPQTEFSIKTANGDMNFAFGLSPLVFTTLMFVMGMAWAFGKASVFKYISDEYKQNMGVVSGVVGLAGGLGGFLLPIMFGVLVDFTGVNSSIFMLLWGITGVSLVWMYWTEIVPLRKEIRKSLPVSTTLAQRV
ncbi:nitrate/nitrite transporter [Thermithiobacillus plumbiphilus]|uniref:Nitrate/nitrite transporter n=1 Tax=Thermithiobacillus plumbiphilus TaxID=1729899 RepID=A0ABU9D820_9PROT